MPLPQAVAPGSRLWPPPRHPSPGPRRVGHWRRSAAEQRTQRTQRTQHMRQLVRHGALLLPLCGICGRDSPSAPSCSPPFVRARPLKGSTGYRARLNIRGQSGTPWAVVQQMGTVLGGSCTQLSGYDLLYIAFSSRILVERMSYLANSTCRAFGC